MSGWPWRFALLLALLAAGCAGARTAPTGAPNPTGEATTASPARSPSPSPTPSPSPATTTAAASPGSSPSPAPEPEPEPSPEPAGASVGIVDFKFEPPASSINPGGTVSWTHTGEINHTVTFSGDGPDSGNLTPGDTFSVTFDEPGRYSYRCRYHGRMTGVITVS